MTFYMMIGVSGSGKSTYIRKHFKSSIVVEPDAIRREVLGSVHDQSRGNEIWGIAKRRVLDLLKSGSDAVLDGVNVRSHGRREFLDDLPKNVHTVAIVFNTDINVAKTRVANDIKAGKDHSNVPAEVIVRQFANLAAGYDNIVNQFDEVIYVEG